MRLVVTAPLEFPAPYSKPRIRVLLPNEPSNATIRGRGGEPRQRNKIDRGLGPASFPEPCGNVITGRSEKSPGTSLIGELLAERACDETVDDSFPGLRIEGVRQPFAGDTGKQIFALQPAGLGIGRFKRHAWGVIQFIMS